MLWILFDEVRPPHHTPPTHHTKKNSQKNGWNGEMVKCRRKYQWKYENMKIAHIIYIKYYYCIEIYYRYIDIIRHIIQIYIIYTIRYILRDVLDILILSYIQCDEETLL